MRVLKKERKGFTILELLAAVVIVGIIVTLAIIAINKYVLQGHNAIDNQIEKQLILATKDYYSDNKSNFIVSKNESSVVWYATLKSNDYITNDLKDSNGNSCSRSFVLIKRQNSKIVYTGCVMCDNNGYSNLNKNKECKESINNDLKCTFTRSNSNKLGIVKQNTDILKLNCVGKKEMILTNNSKTITKDTFSISNGIIENIENATIQKDSTRSQYKLNADINIQTKNDGDLTIVFNGGNNKVGYKESNGNMKEHAPLILTIPVDGKGPLCKLSGPYKDNKLTTPITGVKSKSTVYYGLSCIDDNDIKNIGTISNDTIRDGFGTNIEGVSNLKITNLNKKGNNAISALVNVTVEVPNTNKKTFNLNLKFAENTIQDNLDNGNNEAESEINGKNTTLVIDDQAPTCVFSGPAADIDIKYSKTKLNIKNSNDFVYYSLKCTDENNIENNFNINQITNNGFGKIELEKTNKVKINGIDYGYEYIIKAYSTDEEGTANLTYNTNNTIDLIGNRGDNGIIKSRSVNMYDPNKIPSCDINVTYAEDYRSATLIGYMNDEKGLSGYSWSDNYGEPGSYSSISGTYETVTEGINGNGHYYLHVKNVNDLLGYCEIYVTEIKPAPPEAPEFKANDEIASGKWHTSSYELEASGSGNNVKYYYGTSSNNVTSTTNPKVTSETTGKTYYAKACWADDSTNCSKNTTYEAKLDTNPPSCSLYFTTDKYKSEGGRNTYFSSDEAKEVYAELSCTDSISGVDTTTLYKDGKDSNYDKKLKLTSTGTYTIKAVAYDNAGNKMDGKNHTVKIACELGSWVKGDSTYVTSCTPVTGDTSKVECGKTKYVNYYTYTASKKKCTDYSTPKTTYKWGTAKAKELYKNGQCVFSVPYDKKATPCTNGTYYYDDVECVKCNHGSVGKNGTCDRNTCCIKKKYTIQKCIVKTTEKECTKYKYSDYTKDKGVKVEKDKCKKSGTAGTDKKYYTCGSSTYVLKTPYTRTCK